MLLTRQQVEDQLEKYASDWIAAFHIVHPDSNSKVVFLFQLRGMYEIGIFDLYHEIQTAICFTAATDSDSIRGRILEMKQHLYRVCRETYTVDADYEYIPVEKQLYGFVEDV